MFGAHQASKPSPADPDLGSGLSDVFLAALVLRTGATNGTTPRVILKQGIVAGASSAEFSVRFDQNLDGDACYAKGEQQDGQQHSICSHASKVEGMNSAAKGLCRN